MLFCLCFPSCSRFRCLSCLGTVYLFASTYSTHLLVALCKQLACLFHPKYDSRQSSTYKPNGTYGSLYIQTITSTATMIAVACCLVGLSSASLFGIYSGTPASIHYGTGGIAGFYSQDQVTVGNLVVQNQVLHFPSCYLPNSLHMWNKQHWFYWTQLNHPGVHRSHSRAWLHLSTGKIRRHPRACISGNFSWRFTSSMVRQLPLFNLF
jgi:hypothetical protein